MPKLAYRTTLPKPDDPELLDTLCQQIALGVPLVYAGANAGLSDRTINYWIQLGEAELADLPEGAQPEREELGSHARFVLAVKEAEARLVSESVEQWRTDKAGSWQRWPTLLERRMPEHFGRRDRLQVDQRTLTVTLDATQLPPAKLAALGRILQEMGETPQLPDTTTTTE